MYFCICLVIGFLFSPIYFFTLLRQTVVRNYHRKTKLALTFNFAVVIRLCSFTEHCVNIQLTYSSELEIRDTTNTPTPQAYLDIHLELHNRGMFHTKPLTIGMT